MCDEMERDNESIESGIPSLHRNISAATCVFTYQWCENISLIIHC